MALICTDKRQINNLKCSETFLDRISEGSYLFRFLKILAKIIITQGKFEHGMQNMSMLPSDRE